MEQVTGTPDEFARMSDDELRLFIENENRALGYVPAV